MSEIKGIDVSRWNGNIDWKTVSNYGMGFVILRITEKGNVIDSTFEANYKGCTENKIPVGVYKYSYATNVSQIKEEANIVIKTLKSRKLDYPVFLDIEDKCQENISKDDMLKMIKAFRSIVIKAGYKFGIYCGYSWFKNLLPEDAKKYDVWVARYPSNDTGDLQERLRVPASEGVIGWQYSSKATIPGISTKVDRNVFYKDYTKKTSSNTNTYLSTSNKITITLTVEQIIESMIEVAEEEIGYLEKKTNSQLDDKTANAGTNNYTKYWRDVYPQYQAQAWCACFVSWVFMKAFGLETAKKLLKHWPYVYCPTLGSLFTKYANPKVGDIVIFYRNGTFAHTGIVVKVNGDYFETIEGNTSGGSTIIANGGGVCRKSYYNSKLPGTKFCRPDYSIVTSNTSSSSNTTSSKPSTYDSKQLVKDAQTHLNNFVNAGLKVDGVIGSATKKAYISAIQFALNKDYKYNFSCKGVWGPKTEAALSKVAIKKGSKGQLVTVLEIGMLLHGIDPKGVESPGIMGDGLVAAVKEYQKLNKLTVDGIAGVNTFKSLIK